MWIRKEIGLKPKKRGFHLTMEEMLRALPGITNFRAGLMNRFILHASASLTISENADPSVRKDFETGSPPKGIYLCEHGNDGGMRRIAVTVHGEWLHSQARIFGSFLDVWAVFAEGMPTMIGATAA